MPKSNRTEATGSNWKRAVVLLALVAVVIAVFMIVSSLSNSSQERSEPASYKLNIADGEGLAMARLRLAVSQSAVDGTGSITSADCKKLQQIAQNYDPSADWFSSCEPGGSLRGEILDTATTEVIQISDGDYCATLKTTDKGSTLSSYSFISEPCEGYRFTIE